VGYDLEVGELPERMASPMREYRRAESLRAVAIAALALHVGLGLFSDLLFLAAFQFRLDWFADPIQAIGAGSTSAELLRWGAATDLLSYYLPVAVIAYVLWRTLQPLSAFIADVSALAALAYVVAGGTGAAVLAVGGPMLMNDYTAPGADQAAIGMAFGILIEVVFRAIWQFLDPLLLAAWWLGVGLLVRVGQPRLAVLSFALSAAAAVGAGLTLVGLDLARDLLLGAFFVGWTTWSVWLLVLFWRRSDPFGRPAAS